VEACDQKIECNFTIAKGSNSFAVIDYVRDSDSG